MSIFEFHGNYVEFELNDLRDNRHFVCFRRFCVLVKLMKRDTTHASCRILNLGLASEKKKTWAPRRLNVKYKTQHGMKEYADDDLKILSLNYL